MSILKILHHPDPRLRIVADEVKIFDDCLKTTAQDMLATMYHESGIGLAATQVNVHKRLLVMDVSENRSQPWICVNPKLTVPEDAMIEPHEEGCLSVPEYTEIVNRPHRVLMEYQDTDGNKHTHDADGLLAVCVQHECDHLEGKLFIDYLSLLKRNRISRKLQKLAKQ